MFKLTPLIFILAVCQIGCGQKPVAKKAGPQKLEFDPNLILKWPIKPHENSHVLELNNGVMKIYLASSDIRFGDGMLFFYAYVEEYPDDKFDGHTPEQMLFFHNAGTTTDETSRKKIEFGPKKYPGLEVEYRNEKSTDRKIEVLAGRRIYSIKVCAARNEKLLERPEVAAFFESFNIEE